MQRLLSCHRDGIYISSHWCFGWWREVDAAAVSSGSSVVKYPSTS